MNLIKKIFNGTKTYLSDVLNKWKYNFKSKYRQTYNNLLPIFTNTCSVNTWEKYKVFSWKCVKFDTWVFLLYFLHKIVVQWLACQFWCIFRTKWFIYFYAKNQHVYIILTLSLCGTDNVSHTEIKVIIYFFVNII